MNASTENTDATERSASERMRDQMRIHGITVLATFVPFSQSRNKDEKSPSLNWRITLQVRGRDVLTTDYMAGCAHCPAYSNAAMKKALGPRDFNEALRIECEGGKTIKRFAGGFHAFGPPILPNECDVMFSLLLDAQAIDYGGLEEWASDYGYDTDSRKGEATYRDCVEHGLKLRAALGDDALRAMQDIAAEY